MLQHICQPDSAAAPKVIKAKTAGSCSSHNSFWLCSSKQWRLPKHGQLPNALQAGTALHAPAAATICCHICSLSCADVRGVSCFHAAVGRASCQCVQAAALTPHHFLPELVAGCWWSSACCLAAAGNEGCQKRKQPSTHTVPLATAQQICRAQTLTAGCPWASHICPWSLQLRAVEAANAQAAAKTRRDFDARLAEQQAANEEDLDERLSAATKRVLQHNRSLQQELRMHTEVK